MEFGYEGCSITCNCVILMFEIWGLDVPSLLTFVSCDVVTWFCDFGILGLLVLCFGCVSVRGFGFCRTWGLRLFGLIWLIGCVCFCGFGLGVVVAVIMIGVGCDLDLWFLFGLFRGCGAGGHCVLRCGFVSFRGFAMIIAGLWLLRISDFAVSLAIVGCEVWVGVLFLCGFSWTCDCVLDGLSVV